MNQQQKNSGCATQLRIFTYGICIVRILRYPDSLHWNRYPPFLFSCCISGWLFKVRISGYIHLELSEMSIKARSFFRCSSGILRHAIKYRSTFLLQHNCLKHECVECGAPWMEAGTSTVTTYFCIVLLYRTYCTKCTGSVGRWLYTRTTWRTVQMRWPL